MIFSKISIFCKILHACLTFIKNYTRVHFFLPSFPLICVLLFFFFVLPPSLLCIPPHLVRTSGCPLGSAQWLMLSLLVATSNTAIAPLISSIAHLDFASSLNQKHFKNLFWFIIFLDEFWFDCNPKDSNFYSTINCIRQNK